MQEIWKDIKGYEGLYEVSSLGRIRKIVKQAINKKGYKIFNLVEGNNKKVMQVHRAVMLSFVPNPENKPQVNHKNGDKTDNRLENLEWCTAKENTVHALENNLRPNKAYKEKKIKKAKSLRFDLIPVSQYDKNGNFIKKWSTIREAVKFYNLDLGNISKCCRGKRKSTGGYIWRI